MKTNSHKQNALINLRKRTALQNLALRYLRFAIISVIMILWCPIFAVSQPLITFKQYIAVGFAIFFCVCGSMDYWLFMGIKSINPAKMTTAEVAERAFFYRKRHLQFQMILIPMALGLLTSIFLMSASRPWFIFGIFVGMIVGVAIGLYQFIHIMTDYRELIKGIDKEDEDNIMKK